MKKSLIKLSKRYRLFLVLAAANAVLVFALPEVGMRSLELSWQNLLQMLAVVPPVFILLGLLDVWVKKDTMIRLMGERSGILGILIAFFLGSAAAGPLYAAFPVAGVLMKKGSKLSNVLIFIGAWSTTKIPLLLFEASAMGWKFMVVRFLVNLPGIALIAFATEKLMGGEEIRRLYENAERL